MYFNRRLNEMVLQMPRFFPSPTTENLVIGVSASETRSTYSVLISNRVTSLHAVDMVGSQYFPLYLYDTQEDADDDVDGTLFSNSKTAARKANSPQRRDAITNEGLAHFQDAHPGEAICKEDVFYYVYGILHSPDYRERFADNLGKELPRIPRVKTAADFWAFSKAGRALAELHVNYEKVPVYAEAKVVGGGKPGDYRVEKMRYGKSGKDKDLTTLHYNDKITVTGIPLEAYEYVVNGKPALDWVVERQSVRTDKESGIVNDANDWATETMKNPKYPLELFLRVITVSLETMKIVKALPVLDILESTSSSARKP
jgi:predicted helicase